MKRVTWCLAVMCALIMAIGAARAQDAAKVAGNWEMMTQGRNGPQTSAMTVQQDGAKITGTISRQGPQGELKQDFTGTVDGNKIMFAVEVTPPQGDPIKVEYTGTVEGDAMKGTYNMRGNDRDWSAKRK
jgi:hypothetical protein